MYDDDDVCCQRYPSCMCAASDAWSRHVRRRLLRRTVAVILVLLLTGTIVGLLAGCDPFAGPRPVPTDRPSELYTVIRPS